jgi:hypothetical protein
VNDKKEQQHGNAAKPIHIPLDFEETLADLLKVKPPPDVKPDSGKPTKKPKKAKS